MNDTPQPKEPESLLQWVILAGEKGGWALALIVGLAGVALAVLAIYAKAPQQIPLVDIPAPEEHTTVVQELETAPQLATSYDICLDPATRAAHFPEDDHFEADLVQNLGQLNEVRYHLFWRPDQRLQVIIEETRAGLPTLTRTDPHTQQFDDCIKGKKVEEVRPRP